MPVSLFSNCFHVEIFCIWHHVNCLAEEDEQRVIYYKLSNSTKKKITAIVRQRGS